MLKQIFLAGLMTMLLAACHSGTTPHIDEEFGNAVRQNVAVQTLNPDAGGPDESDSLDGPRAAQAVQRMRNRSNQAQSGGLIQGLGQQ